MVAQVTDRVTRPAGSTVHFYLERGPEPQAPAAKKSALPGASPAVDYISRPLLRYYLLHTRYAYSPDSRDTYDPILIELEIQLGDSTRAVAEHAMLDFFDRARVHGSDREIWSTAPLQSGSSDTDGLILAARFRGPTGHVEERDVIGLTGEWSPRVPYELRSQDLRDLIASTPADSPSLPKLRAALEQSDKEALESWDAPALYYSGHDGVQQPGLLPGAYQLGIKCLRHAQPWDSWDRENFKVTAQANPEGADTAFPDAMAATNMSTAFDIFLAPQYWEILVSWFDVYVIGTIFFLSYTVFANNGVFAGPLPALPKPYSLAGGTQNAANGVAMSRYVERTQTYARMRRQALALNIITPFFFIQLVASIGGRVTIITLNQPAGALCAVVECHVGDGPALRCHVYRKTELVRPNVLVDQVALNILGEVVGADLLYVDGTDVPVPTPEL